MDKYTTDSDEGVTSFFVIFEFSGPWGRCRFDDLNEDAYHRLEIGDTVSVRYLPEQPWVCALQLPPALDEP